jgi:peptidoglycan hydrolase-like protein with peptidoglycan-binding domain
MLNVGSRGSDVTRLQKALAKQGYDPGGADGIFGPKTKAAVERFQKAKKLDSDGKVGSDTGRALFHSSSVSYWDGKNDSGGGASGSGGVPAKFPSGGTNRQKLDYAGALAKQLDLRITSTTGGKHAKNSYHYSGRAIDVAGTPKQMAEFYRRLAGTKPTEMFYDPMGGIKNGKQIGAIGGHRDHVHIAS